MSEHTDVVIVGGRCAGSAAAIAFARQGRRVVVLDSAAFPSDTLSTHLLFPPHWAELDKLGARERVLELGAPLHVRAGVGAPGLNLVAPYSAYDGWAAGGCVRRPGLDLALVQTAREAGAEVRERTRVTGLERDATGRVTGVRYRRRNDADGIITAALVVGADGRGSTVARLVGAGEHHRWDNQRMMAYAYYQDCHAEERDVAMQWRDHDDLVTVFPCDGEQFVALQMPPVRRADEYRADPEAAFAATIDRVAPYRDRLRGCTPVSKVVASYSHPSYFRHSHGPGWALAGDAGHFKDPVTAQGIRDALRFGRLLGEATGEHLDSPAALDAALADWESDRDAQCLPMYQWANQLGRDDAVSVIEMAAYRWFAARPERTTMLLDVFSRKRSPTEVFAARRLVGWLSAAVRDPEVDNRELWRTLRRDARRELDRVVEYRMFTRRREASARALAARHAAAPPRGGAPVPVDQLDR